MDSKAMNMAERYALAKTLLLRAITLLDAAYIDHLAKSHDH